MQKDYFPTPGASSCFVPRMGQSCWMWGSDHACLPSTWFSRTDRKGSGRWSGGKGLFSLPRKICSWARTDEADWGFVLPMVWRLLKRKIRLIPCYPWHGWSLDFGEILVNGRAKLGSISRLLITERMSFITWLGIQRLSLAGWGYLRRRLVKFYEILVTKLASKLNKSKKSVSDLFWQELPAQLRWQKELKN